MSKNKTGFIANLKKRGGEEWRDTVMLLRNVPGMVTMAFVLSVVVMNLMASKVIFQIGNVAGTGGILLSWIPFLCMDTVTKHFGSKASIKLNLLAAVINLFCVGVFSLVVAIPGNGQDYSMFNSVFSSVWFILLGSTVAFVASGIVNSLLNSATGAMFKKNPDSAVAFFTRSYVSTFIGQFVDNFLFAFIVYYIFAPKYFGFGFPIATCIGTGIGGSLLELLTEVIFSPIGYRLTVLWKRDNIGAEYLARRV